MKYKVNSLVSGFIIIFIYLRKMFSSLKSKKGKSNKS